MLLNTFRTPPVKVGPGYRARVDSPNEHPKWVVVVLPDRAGGLFRAEPGTGAVGHLRSVIRLRGRPRYYEAAHANLPNGGTVRARRRRVWGGVEFTFDRPLPERAQIVLTLRGARAHLPETRDDRQWWEKR